eukprot:g20449.t1
MTCSLQFALCLGARRTQQEPFVQFAESLSSDDLADLGHLTMKRAGQQCQKACGNFREMAAEFCESCA